VTASYRGERAAGCPAGLNTDPVCEYCTAFYLLTLGASRDWLEYDGCRVIYDETLEQAG
jgi:hypothetical protein